MYKKSLDIQIVHYGESNFLSGNTYGNIGSLYHNQGKLEEALEMFTKCINIEKVHYGENNFHLATVY
jgi:tetratricopeptide (TPR) repeat protein